MYLVLLIILAVEVLRCAVNAVITLSAESSFSIMLGIESILCVLCVMFTVTSQTALKFDRETADAGVHWAIIVAGSNGWDNYRHQVNFRILVPIESVTMN